MEICISAPTGICCLFLKLKKKYFVRLYRNKYSNHYLEACAYNC